MPDSHPASQKPIEERLKDHLDNLLVTIPDDIPQDPKKDDGLDEIEDLGLHITDDGYYPEAWPTPGKQPTPQTVVQDELGRDAALVVGRPFSKGDLLALHDETCTKARAIMEQKNNDYTGGKGTADPFANFRMAEVIGMDPVMGLLLRMMDKIQRVRTFASDGELKVSGESVDDAFDDMVNYAILGKGMMRERRST